MLQIITIIGLLVNTAFASLLQSTFNQWQSNIPYPINVPNVQNIDDSNHLIVNQDHSRSHVINSDNYSNPYYNSNAKDQVQIFFNNNNVEYETLWNQLNHNIAEDLPIHQQTSIAQIKAVPIIKNIGIPVNHPVDIPVSHLVPVNVPQPYPVHVGVPHPIIIPVLRTVPVPVTKKVPYPIEKIIPVPEEKHIPVFIEKYIPVPVETPYPIRIPIYKYIFHGVQKYKNDKNFRHRYTRHYN